MDYKKVLESQINKLEEVQEQVLKGIIEGKENAAYTQTTLSVIASTSARIESLVASIARLEEKNKEVADLEVPVQVQPLTENTEFIDKIAKAIGQSIGKKYYLSDQS